MKMHCYFLLNVKHGASQLYLEGGLQLSSAGTVAMVIRILSTRKYGNFSNIQQWLQCR